MTLRRTDRMTQIIRLGVGPEFADLYDLIGEADNLRDTGLRTIQTWIARVQAQYTLCELSRIAINDAVDDFIRQSPDDDSAAG